jgi:hypothetical protein
MRDLASGGGDARKLNAIRGFFERLTDALQRRGQAFQVFADVAGSRNPIRCASH